MKPFTKIASFVFAVVALGHLIRLLLHVQVTIGSHTIPMYISVAGFIAALVLCIALFREAK